MTDRHEEAEATVELILQQDEVKYLQGLLKRKKQSCEWVEGSPSTIGSKEKAKTSRLLIEKIMMKLNEEVPVEENENIKEVPDGQ